VTRSILVTGGAGYIGSVVAKHLYDEGFFPVVLDNLATGFESNVRWGPFYKGNISNTKLIEAIQLEHKIEGVIHFAASAYVGESIQLPFKYFQNNVSESIAFFAAISELGINSVVFSSSCATYGIPISDTISESHTQSPINPYGESKLLTERVLRSLCSVGRLRFAILRYFNACGAEIESGLGEIHDPETHVIPLAVRASRSGEVFSIFGNDYPTEDGTAVRDYVHVTDLAVAHVLALKKMLSGSDSFSINLGSGKGVSVGEIVSIIRSTGRSIDVVFRDRRPGDPPRLVANTSKSKMELGWIPKQSNIFSILDSEFAWQQLPRT
jgi:UDP-arabinose 4-epimerase